MLFRSIFLGGLCGYNLSGTITNCYVTGTVTGGSNASYLGGLCGLNYGTISDCYAAVTVSAGTNASYAGGLCGYNLRGSITGSYATGTVTGQTNSRELGGLCGSIHYDAPISNSYATGNVSGGSNVGGFVGHNDQGSITHCYSTGRVTGDRSVGGFCGNLYPGSGNVNIGNFWDTETSQTGVSAMGTGKTTGEMKTLGTFSSAGWDVRYTWWMPGGDYPRLVMELGGYSGGKGTPREPYRIGTVGDWQVLTSRPADWGKNFVLIRDIDFAGAALTPVAADTDPATAEFQGEQFRGYFDGQGYVLRNAVINRPGCDFVGLFGDLGKYGVLYNIGVENISVTAASRVGGLVGRNDGGSIFSCTTSGAVAGSGANTVSVGGLVGVTRANGTVSRCSSACTVSGVSNVGGLAGYLFTGEIKESFAVGQVSGTGENIGGLVGYIYDTQTDGYVRDCYARGRVIGGNNVGGLVGHNYRGFVSDCYSTGRPTGTNTFVGGFCGRRQFVYTEPVNFWDIQTSQTSNSSMGVGKTTAQMKMLSTFTGMGWDFAKRWAICEGTGYPRLRRQIAAGDFACPDGVGVEDLGFFAERWLAEGCALAGGCDGVDLDRDGVVNMADLAVLAGQWLKE